ncbi:MAG: hypothetical protein HOB79_04255 [Rhodospirillaceae bacterium]|nr:hypothetical protein [Rhodospirillaceae bacterium]
MSVPIVWIIQVAGWLKDGYWQPFPLAVITGRMSGSDWVGWQSIVNWVADINLGVVLIFVGWVFYGVKKLDSEISNKPPISFTEEL